MYTISGYGSMLGDRVRMDAYDAALRSAIQPGAVVLDIGAGTGILSLLACQYGARKVYAVEVADAIAVAAEMAHKNGLGDRIEFIRAKSTDLELPELANVIVSDLRGVLPLLQAHIPSIIDARQRLLAPGGVLIPARDELWAAIVEAPERYGRLTEPWATGRFGFDMRVARDIVTNTWQKASVTPEQLLTEPQAWASIDYSTVESTDVAGTVVSTVARHGVAHGVVVWFDAFLGDGARFSNAPGQPPLIYGSGFFPLSAAVDVEPGDRVSVALRADLIQSDYVWSWDTTIHDGESVRAKAQFRQSTFFGGPLSIERAHKRGSRFKPALTEQGAVDSTILQAMTGDHALDDIARLVMARHPGQFRSPHEALARVADLSEQYSRSRT
jgi:type I protein arginine methyltransferase